MFGISFSQTQLTEKMNKKQNTVCVIPGIYLNEISVQKHFSARDSLKLFVMLETYNSILSHLGH